MHYHLILTQNCNSKCKYCYEKSMIEENDLNKKFNFDFDCPNRFNVDVSKIKKFLENDKEAVLIFYGGEPLLEKNKIIEIIDNVNVPFRMQTNGKLLDKFPKNYINKIGKILVSIDGDKKRTDYNRGNGTYDILIKNINHIKKEGYQGEIIARMTVSFPDIYEQVLSLIKNNFESIHWQLDMGFYKHDFEKNKIKGFVEKYNKSISKLIDYWIQEMKKGKVLKIYPFLGIAESLLKKEKTKLRCGAGYEGYAISTDGKIVACPIMNCMEDFVCGTLESNKLKKIYIDGKCEDCEEKDVCGGRCLYWNKTKLWPKEGDELICITIKHLISTVKGKMTEIEKMIKENKIKTSDFEYEKYFGPEIIP